MRSIHTHTQIKKKGFFSFVFKKGVAAFLFDMITQENGFIFLRIDVSNSNKKNFLDIFLIIKYVQGEGENSTTAPVFLK